MSNVLVFGATGQLGSAVINQLLLKGWKVTAVTRARPECLPKGVEAIIADRLSRTQIIKSLGRTFDAVFEPTAYSDDDATDLLSSCSYFGTAIIVSSCSVYADSQGRSLDEAAITGFPEFPSAMTEDTATVPSGPETYSTRKVAMENVFRASKLPTTILRPCAIYGPNATHPREWWLIKRALDGRHKIPIAYNGQSVFHTSSATSIASLAEICMQKPKARILNVADPMPLNIHQIAGALQNETSLPINLHPFEGKPRGNIGASPWSVPRPYVLDSSRAKALGWDGGEEYASAVKDMARWLLSFQNNPDWKSHFHGFSNYAEDPFDYASENRFLSA